MARLEFEYNKAEFLAFRELANQFPELRARLMGHVGKSGKDRLYINFLKGQAITLDDSMKDKVGRPTVNYSVGRNANVVSITAYPMNLFERGRMLRSGRKEQGKKVIKGSFKQMMNSQLQGILQDFDRTILQQELNKV